MGMEISLESFEVFDRSNSEISNANTSPNPDRSLGLVLVLIGLVLVLGLVIGSKLGLLLVIRLGRALVDNFVAAVSVH